MSNVADKVDSVLARAVRLFVIATISLCIAGPILFYFFAPTFGSGGRLDQTQRAMQHLIADLENYAMLNDRVPGNDLASAIATLKADADFDGVEWQAIADGNDAWGNPMKLEFVSTYDAVLISYGEDGVAGDHDIRFPMTFVWLVD